MNTQAVETLLTAFADVEPVVAILEAQVQNPDRNEANLVAMIESLRSFSERARSVANRAAFVTQQIEATLSQVRDLQREAKRAA